ncbi:hypothetical protein ACFFHH_22345 [Cytobacillus solani]|uniref:hypothetical protein n=1 Tax=Cytobacillus solani TaxID=1637975 RepID=UPI000A4BE090|nr:hypothetical protein [Cytobacillus solani]
MNQKISKTDAITFGIEIGNQNLMNSHNYIVEPSFLQQKREWEQALIEALRWIKKGFH